MGKVESPVLRTSNLKMYYRTAFRGIFVQGPKEVLNIDFQTEKMEISSENPESEIKLEGLCNLA